MCIMRAFRSQLLLETSGASNEAKGDNTDTAVSGTTANLTITDVELLNPTDYQVILPDTSSIAYRIQSDNTLGSIAIHLISNYYGLKY